MLDWQVPTSRAPGLAGCAATSRNRTILFAPCDSEAGHRVRLEHGADDYMSMPVRRQELLARLHALLRRAYPSRMKSSFVSGRSTSISHGEIRKDGVRSSSRPRIRARGDALRTWGACFRAAICRKPCGGAAATRYATVDTHVSQVRQESSTCARIRLPRRPGVQLRLRLESTAPSRSAALQRSCRRFCSAYCLTSAVSVPLRARDGRRPPLGAPIEALPAKARGLASTALVGAVPARAVGLHGLAIAAMRLSTEPAPRRTPHSGARHCAAVQNSSR